MVFNIEYGGTLVDFGKVVEAVQRAGADIVAIEEAYGNSDRLAAALGWHHIDRRTQVISHHPVIEIRGPRGTAVTLVELSPGCVVAVGNVHLPSDPAVDSLLLQGKRDAIVAVERLSRLPPLAPVLADLRLLADSGLPVFLAGDFNAGSHLDDGFPWPTSLAVAQAGFHDAYRETHPDAVAHPGFTWWAARPKVAGWNPAPEERQQRIDYLHWSGPARVTATRIVGERGGRDVDVMVEPWMSDHRALVGIFEVAPAPLPAVVTVAHQRVTAGEEIAVQWRTGDPDATIVIGQIEAGGNRRLISRWPADTSDTLRTLPVATQGLVEGEYEVLLRSGTDALAARARFWLTPRDAAPRVAPTQSTFHSGAPLTMQWSNAPGQRWDWIGVYPDSADPGDTNPLLWRHTGAAIGGTMLLDQTAEGGAWPLAPGKYRVVLSLDDSYVVLASAEFMITR